MFLKSINPATGEVIREYEEFHSDEIDSAIDANYKAYKSWRKEPVVRRAQLLLKAANVLREKQEAE